MTTRRVIPGGNRFLSIGAAAGSLALLAAVVLMLWPPDPGDYAFTPGDRPDGETVGWVSKVESNTIHVNSGPFGGGVVPLVVTKTTRITVGAKDGWFEDIRPGGQVKVAYELYHGRRFARSVELLVDEGSRRPGRGSPQPKGPTEAQAPAERPTTAPAASSAAATSAPPVAAPPAAAPPAAAPPAPATAPKVAAPSPAVSVAPPVVVAPAPAPQPAPTTAAKPAPAPEVRPTPRPEPAPAPARPQPAEIVPAPQRASTATPPTQNVSAPANGPRAPEPARAVETVRPAAPAAPRPAEPARTSDSDATDGSAAVDWLLKRR